MRPLAQALKQIAGSDNRKPCCSGRFRSRHVCCAKKQVEIRRVEWCGFNVYPRQVEQVIWSHPAVQDCAVVGVPDEKWGEAVKAVVELNAGQTVSAEELIAQVIPLMVSPGV